MESLQPQGSDMERASLSIVMENFISGKHVYLLLLLVIPLTLVRGGGVRASRLWSTSQLLRPTGQQFRDLCCCVVYPLP